MKTNRNLLIAPFLVVPLIVSCGGSKPEPKEWKEISRAEAIKLEADILGNFVAPDFYSSSGTYKVNDEAKWEGEFEAYSKEEKFYKTTRAHGEDDVECECKYYRVIEEKIWNFRASHWEKPNPAEQERTKEFTQLSSSEEALETLQTYILYYYARTIYSFENCIDKAEEYRQYHEAHPTSDYNGDYHFYSKDKNSLRGEFTMKRPDYYNDNTECIEQRGTLEFNNKLPSFIFSYSKHNDDPSTEIAFTFQYENKPVLPADANPTDWC